MGALLIAGGLSAAESAATIAGNGALLGDLRAQPSCENPVGWRGDGNGRYPGAEPTLTWGRSSKAVTELRSQASKPKAGETGKPIPDGVVREWLVMGFVDMPEDKKSADDFGTAEAQYEPEENAKTGNLTWKLAMSAPGDSPWVNFLALFDKTLDKPNHENFHRGEEVRLAGYAHTWIYSPSGKPVIMNLIHCGVTRVWLNGNALGAFENSGFSHRTRLPLAQGWNRLLFRVTPRATTQNVASHATGCNFTAEFFGDDPADYESKNIVWTTLMPDNGHGISSPIVVGDKIFVQAEYCDLVCLRKTDGKVLWAKSTTYADVATEEDKKLHADVFAKVAPLQTGVAELLNAYCAAPDRYFQKDTGKGFNTQRREMEKDINTLVKGISTNRFSGQSDCDAGEAAPTPASDGERVYVLFGTGVVACYDLNGNRLWAKTVEGFKPCEHGYAASPCLVDGKLIIVGRKNFAATALDCKTGATLWSSPAFTAGCGILHSSPIRATWNAQKLLILSWGSVARASDGQVLAQDWRPPSGGLPIPSPTVEGQKIVSCGWVKGERSPIAMGGVAFQTLPDSAVEPFKMRDGKIIPLELGGQNMQDGAVTFYDTRTLPTWHRRDQTGSPLLYNGLAYLVNEEGVLFVMDAAKGEIVYQKVLDLAPMPAGYASCAVETGCAASPTLGGKHIFIWDNQGATIVIEPGRVFKQVARNRIEQFWYRGGRDNKRELPLQESTASCPVFEGNRLYFRGEVNLYCIGATNK